jgi:hypothetical protein
MPRRPVYFVWIGVELCSNEVPGHEAILARGGLAVVSSV